MRRWNWFSWRSIKASMFSRSSSIQSVILRSTRRRSVLVSPKWKWRCRRKLILSIRSFRRRVSARKSSVIRSFTRGRSTNSTRIKPTCNMARAIPVVSESQRAALICLNLNRSSNQTIPHAIHRSDLWLSEIRSLQLVDSLDYHRE